MAKKTLLVPERRLRMADGQTVLFRGDHMAWYTLEKHTGLPIMDFVARVQGGVALTSIYDIAWCMSATDRRKSGSSETYEDFLDRLPPITQIDAFAGALMEIVQESFAGEATPGNGSIPRKLEAAREPASIGTGDIISDGSSSS